MLKTTQKELQCSQEVFYEIKCVFVLQILDQSWILATMKCSLYRYCIFKKTSLYLALSQMWSYNLAHPFCVYNDNLCLQVLILENDSLKREIQRLKRDNADLVRRMKHAVEEKDSMLVSTMNEYNVCAYDKFIFVKSVLSDQTYLWLIFCHMSS